MESIATPKSKLRFCIPFAFGQHRPPFAVLQFSLRRFQKSARLESDAKAKNPSGRAVLLGHQDQGFHHGLPFRD